MKRFPSIQKRTDEELTALGYARFNKIDKIRRGSKSDNWVCPDGTISHRHAIEATLSQGPGDPRVLAGHQLDALPQFQSYDANDY